MDERGYVKITGRLKDVIVRDGIEIYPELRETLFHPDYDPEGRISAFNVLTAEGLAHYKAFVEFVAERYTRPDARYGRACGYIIGNEVDAQWTWCNAGEKTVEQYVREHDAQETSRQKRVPPAPRRNAGM